MLALEVLRSHDAVRGLRREWDALCDAAPGVTPFQRPAWALAWMHHMGAACPEVAAVRAGRDLVGLLPAFSWADPSGERSLALLGAGISDHLDAIAAAGFERGVMDTVAGWAADGRRPWNACVFDEVGPDALLRRIPALPGVASSSRPQSVCPVLRWSADRSELTSIVPRAQYARLGRARRRCDRFGGAAIERADRRDPLGGLDLLLALHARRWHERGQPGVLADPRLAALHREVADAFARAGRLRLYVLRVAGQAAAVVYGFREGRTVHLYLQGIDPAFEWISPGVVAIGGAIEDASAEGVEAVDFLRGHEPYKYAWGAVDQASERVTVTRNA